MYRLFFNQLSEILSLSFSDVSKIYLANIAPIKSNETRWAMISQKILSITEVCDLVGRNRRTLWAWVRDGVFPEPIKVHGKTVGWPESVYQNWLAAQMAGK